MKKNLLMSFIIIWATQCLSAQLIDNRNKTTEDSLHLRAAMSSYKENMPQIIPSSPQSQIFENYLNHEASPYNGLPQIEIPLYEIEVKGLKIPITLSYQASGIKYMQYDGDIAAGWNINVEGYRVIRTVKGASDFNMKLKKVSKKTDLWELAPNGDQRILDGSMLGLSIDPENPSQRLSGITDGVLNEVVDGDGQYDEFSYITPTTGGNFILKDRLNNSVDIIQGHPDNIVINKKECLISDNSGIQYYFGGGDNDDFIELENYTKHETAWVLKKIVTPDNTSIHFKYKKYDTNSQRQKDPYSSLLITDAPYFPNVDRGIYHGCGIPGENERVYIYPFVADRYNYLEMLFLDEIETDNIKIEFQRKEFLGMPYLLKKITITSKLTQQIVKEVEFDTGISSSEIKNNEDYSFTPSHLLLNSVVIQREKYKMEYYGFPDNFRYAYPDKWNNYNFNPEYAIEEKQMYLDKKYYETEYLSQSVYEDDTPQLIENKKMKLSSYQYYSKYFADRSVDEDNLNSFSLKKITFPTGGYSEYTYEPHESQTEKGGGLRIKQIISEPGTGLPSIISKYKYNKGYATFTMDDNHFSSISYSISHGQLYCGIAGENPWYIQINRSRIYSMQPFGEFSSSAYQVYYPDVDIYQYDQNTGKYNGRKNIKYKLPSKPIIDFLEGSYLPYPSSLQSVMKYRVQNSFPGERPTMESVSYFNESDKLLKKEEYDYKKVHVKEYEGVKVDQNISSAEGHIPSYPELMDTDKDGNDYKYISSYVDWSDYTITTGAFILSSKIDTTYTDKGIISTIESYTYNDKNQLSRTSQTSSKNDNIVKELKYPQDFISGNNVYQQMVDKNMISPIVEEVIKYGEKKTKKTVAEYIIDPDRTKGLIQQGTIKTLLNNEDNLRTDVVFDRYDKRGNLLQYTTIDGVSTSYLWSYNGQYPIAEIQNATYEQVVSALGSISPESLSLASEPDMDAVNALRTKLPQAQVSTYTYQPLIGITSATDARGLTTYYEYDDFGRLSNTRVDDLGVKNLLESYQYHYSGNTDTIPGDLPETDSISPIDPEPELTPDPYQKGRTSSVLINIGAKGEGSYGLTGWNYDTQKVEQNNVITKTYKTIEAGEYIWTTENLRLKYGTYGSSIDMTWVNFTQADVDKFADEYLNGQKIPLKEFEEIFGTWATLYPTAIMYRNIYWGVPNNDGTFDHSWGLPSKEDIWQMYGQAPRTSGNVYEDIKDFLFASACDNKYGWTQNMFNRRNISGLTLTPLGMRESNQGGALYGFGQVASLQTNVNEKVETLSDKDLSGHSGIISNPYTYHFTQARHRRLLTDEELGYKMYIDVANDQILMLPYTQVSSLPELAKGLDRGIALRYANREHMKVLKKWSEIQAEATEIKSKLTPTNNPAPPELLPCEPEPEPEVTPDPYQKGKEGSVLINIGAKGEGSYTLTGWNYDTQKVEQNNVITKTYKTIEASEYVWTTENLRLKYGNYVNTIMDWANLTQGDVDKYSADYLGGRSIPLEEFEQVYGTWATLYETAMMYRNIYWGVPMGDGVFDHTWGLPAKEDIWQMYGQAPRKSDNLYNDIKDFLFASSSDFNFGWTQGLFNNKNTSGLTLTPLGMRESYNGGAVYGFGQVTSLQTSVWKAIETLSDRDLSGHSGLISNSDSYHFTQARHRRPLTDQELGYKMYIDAANDRVLMLPYDQVSTLTELPKGLERGVALRYANRKAFKVVRKWSEIQAEAADIKSTIIQ